MKKKEARNIYQAKRMEADITQEVAAEALRVSAHTIQNFEAGKREPKISTAFAMADLYGCDVNEFRPEAKKREGDGEDNYSHA